MGQIISFYSYKGGVGRSMALANVAWILASNGKRILAIDWDLEAPGLHRYFAPFILDKELISTDGLLEFLLEFADSALTIELVEPPDAAWHNPLSDLPSWSIRLDYEFSSGGSIDFVPAGRQNERYSQKVNTFDWSSFYERLGGGVFLEAVKRLLCDEYDYVLIDSRTGVSDTSGICTMQMPDRLVVFFTANTQSIEGATGVVRTVRSASQLPIIPVLTRVEYAELDRLAARQAAARDKLAVALARESKAIPGSDRDEAADDGRGSPSYAVVDSDSDEPVAAQRPEDAEVPILEIPYIPFYAYEEVLSTFADQPRQSNSLLSAMEKLAARLSDDDVQQLVPPDDASREAVMSQCARKVPARPVLAQKFSRQPAAHGQLLPLDEGTAAADLPGRIVTFYSYKGGVGRSMALANVAWILASNGKRILMIDWDLEAPGLHRYFAPFLLDRELTGTPGLLEFLIEFTDAAMTPPVSLEGSPPNWHEGFTDIANFAIKIDYPFPRSGTIDFVPAGRQNASYARRVNSFNWTNFYERLGGGIFLEAVKQRLSLEYDYILVDSRTGISDTSGICTVQLPDKVVALFTCNDQSIKGASNVTSRLLEMNAPASGKRLLPVLTRVEMAEKERLDAARDMAHSLFNDCLADVDAAERRTYWWSTEVLYIPYYAYEEVLAAALEARDQKSPLLLAMEKLTAYVSDGDVRRRVDADETSLLTKPIHVDYAQSLRMSSVGTPTPGVAPPTRPGPATSSVARDWRSPGEYPDARESSRATERGAVTGKSRAGRIPLDYYRGMTAIERWRLLVTVAAALLSLTWSLFLLNS